MIEKITEIKNLLGKNKISRAFDELSILVEEYPDYEDKFVLIQSRFYALKNNDISGVISKNEITNENANICKSILDLLELIKTDIEPNEANNNSSLIDFNSITWLIIISVLVGIVITILNFILK